MSVKKQEADFSLIDRFVEVVKAGKNGETEEVNGQLQVHVMPERVIKEIRERIQEIEGHISSYNCQIYEVIPREIEQIKQAMTRGYEDYLMLEIKGDLERKKRKLAETVAERDRLMAMRVRYEEMILKVLESCLK